MNQFHYTVLSVVAKGTLLSIVIGKKYNSYGREKIGNKDEWRMMVKEKKLELKGGR